METSSLQSKGILFWDTMADCTTCESAKAMHVSVISVFAFLALVAVILRLWARMIKSIKFQLNDYLCIGGLVCSSAKVHDAAD